LSTLLDMVRQHRAERGALLPAITRYFIDPTTRQESTEIGRIARTVPTAGVIKPHEIEIPTAAIFRPLLDPARYKAVYGGRGSGKSHFLGELLVEECLRTPGTLAVCVRETQKTLRESAKRLIESKIIEHKVGGLFEVLHDRIKTPGGGLIIFVGMADHTAESIKSLEGFRICWVEEAQTLSERSLALLRPTIRVEDSEIWANWNPRRPKDAIDQFLRQKKPENAIVVKANWRDNPWFPQVLEDERQLDLELYPERYEHIWEGDFARAFEGAYFAQGLTVAKQQGRISHVALDPVLPARAYLDIGGAGAKADATSIWIVQFVGREIRVLDYIEGIGQPITYYTNEMRKRGWKDALICTPHDGANVNNATAKRYVDHWADAGFECNPPIKNSGVGAASIRIEAVRRVLPRCWFNETTTEAGRDALGYYHEKKDEQRKVGLGPEHDWSSHAADSFGLMAMDYEEPRGKAAKDREPSRSSGTHWSM
jgi:phage terminase large subunit